ncbi:hypothetical protein [Paraburkholderia sp. MM6662-R1]|uniref:hypothetical protein n=1 Tax=Paraburkholderia sp. MM6662-R1 TaxID=2991066 RepID=UPI003D217133
MTDEFDKAGWSQDEPSVNLTSRPVGRAQAALALELELLTGRRRGESLALAKLLGHISTETTKLYISDVGTCPAPRELLCKRLDCLNTAFAVKVGAAQDKAVSPFSRIHEDMDAVDALSAHLSGLRRQLEE